MSRNVILNQITLCADGSIGLQWYKQVTDDDGTVAHSEPHRSVVDFDGDINAQMDAVFAHLDAMKFKTNNQTRNRMKKLVRDIDTLARADTDITARRQAKIDEKARLAAEEQAKADKLAADLLEAKS
jgi:hypothetical protein